MDCEILYPTAQLRNRFKRAELCGDLLKPVLEKAFNYRAVTHGSVASY